MLQIYLLQRAQVALAAGRKLEEAKRSPGSSVNLSCSLGIDGTPLLTPPQASNAHPEPDLVAIRFSENE